MDDLKLSLIKYDKECKYIHDLDDQDNEQIKQNRMDLLLYCSKLRPYIAFYKMQIKACNSIAHNILKNEVDLILPKFYEGQKSNRGIFSMIISGFIGLVFEGISSFLHHKNIKPCTKQLKLCQLQWTHKEINLCIWKTLWVCTEFIMQKL